MIFFSLIAEMTLSTNLLAQLDIHRLGINVLIFPEVIHGGSYMMLCP